MNKVFQIYEDAYLKSKIPEEDATAKSGRSASETFVGTYDFTKQNTRVCSQM